MNNFSLSGTLLQNPELRYTTDDQTPIATAFLEFTERTKEAARAQIKLIGWGRTADLLKSFAVGSQLLVEGSLRADTIETPDGKRKVVEFNVSRIEPLSTAPQASAAVVTPNDDDDWPCD